MLQVDQPTINQVIFNINNFVLSPITGDSLVSVYEYFKLKRSGLEFNFALIGQAIAEYGFICNPNLNSDHIKLLLAITEGLDIIIPEESPLSIMSDDKILRMDIFIKYKDIILSTNDPTFIKNMLDGCFSISLFCENIFNNLSNMNITIPDLYNKLDMFEQLCIVYNKELLNEFADCLSEFYLWKKNFIVNQEGHTYIINKVKQLICY